MHLGDEGTPSGAAEEDEGYAVDRSGVSVARRWRDALNDPAMRIFPKGWLPRVGKA